jgi:glycosyltransferase involved in cell wall biosynthesis
MAKILFITPLIPYPLSEGARLAQYGIIDSVRKTENVHLLVPISNEIELNNLENLKNEWPNVEFHVFNTIPAKISLKNKILGSIKKRLKPPANYLNDFENPQVTTLFKPKSAALVYAIRDAIKKVNPDIIQIDLLEYIDLIHIIPSNIKTVFVHHELRFGRLLTAMQVIAQNDFYDYVIKCIKNEEYSLLVRYTAICVFNEEDKLKLIHENINPEKVFVSPFPIPEKYFAKEPSKFEKFEKLIFMGPEFHKPNKDAINWYINEIGPLIYKETGMILHVIGNWSQSFIKNNNYPFIHFTGFVDNLDENIKKAIMVVPVRIGSGIRTKILHAMAQDCPVISASIGCEGIGAKHMHEILIANTKSEFLKSVNYLLKNPEVANKITRNANKLIHVKYSQKSCAEQRINVYQSI